MTFRILVKDVNEEKEAFAIIKAELKNHFKSSIKVRKSVSLNTTKDSIKATPCFLIEIPDKEYFEDIERMKEDIQKNGYNHFSDFISDVEDNLSFVPVIKVVSQ